MKLHLQAVYDCDSEKLAELEKIKKNEKLTKESDLIKFCVDFTLKNYKKEV